MREIKFRGLDTNGKWQYGCLVIHGEYVQIFKRENFELVIIDPKTVGQYTGKKDKENKEIYEDDIVEHTQDWIDDDKSNKIRERVFWMDDVTGFNPFADYDSDCQIYVEMKTVKIIGNVHENPELWKEE